MKKSLALLLVLVMCASLALFACTPDAPPVENPGNDNPGNTENPGNTDTPGGNDDPVPADPYAPPAAAAGKTNYVVKVIDQDGNPVADVRFSYCVADMCMPATSNAGGIAYRAYPTDTEVHVTVTMPEGYTADAADLDFYMGAGLPVEVTITATKA